MSKKLTKRGQPIIITRKVLEVEPLTDEGGYGEYDVRGNFTAGKSYRVFGAVWVQFEDRSGVACWLVEDDEGVVTPKAMNRFKVVKTE